MSRRRRRKLKTWIYFPLLIIIIAIITLLFVIFGKGGIPQSEANDSPSLEHLTTQPMPSSTPKPEANRLFAYYTADDSDDGEGKWGYKNEFGESPFEATFDETQEFSEGLAFVGVKQDGSLRYQIIDESGNKITQAVYDDARPFKEGFAAIRQGSHWGFIDMSGALQFPFNYDEVGDFCSGLARVCKDGKWGYIDASSDNNPTIPMSFDSAQDFSGAVAVVGSKGSDGTMTYQIIDTSGIMVKSIGSSEASVFSQGFVAAKIANNQYVYLNNLGQQQFGDETVFEDAKAFSEDLAPVKIDGKWGYIDNSGEIKIEAAYDDAEPFSNSRAAVMQGEKWAYIDKNGSEITDFEFDSAEAFEKGYAEAGIGREVYCVGSNGEKLQLYALADDVIIPEDQTVGTVKLTSGNMNVRKTASTEAEIVTKLANGNKVKIISSEGEWYKIDVSGLEGYIKKEYIVIGDE